MQIRHKLNALSGVYDLYDSFSAQFSFACVRGCCACCTQNVTITSLEGYRIVQHLIATKQSDLFQRLQPTTSQERFRPALTTNQIAALCMRHEDPPEERVDWPQTPCPFLSNRECLIYLERPFGCRCFSSTEKCDLTGQAAVDPFVFTVNMMFMQSIEDIDRAGQFGNMTDVLLSLKSEVDRKQYETHPNLHRAPGLCVNHRIPGLLIPPEHQERIQPLLERLRKITRL
jgi:Fe-S-cluster containining protein